MSIASKRRMKDGQIYWRVNQFLMPFYTLVPPQSKFPELSGHAWVPMDDETTLCIMFSYTPAAPLYPKSRQLFEEGHNGRETGHASRHCYAAAGPGAPYADYWTKFNPATNFHFDYDKPAEHLVLGLAGPVGAGRRLPDGHQRRSTTARRRICARAIPASS